VRKLDVRKNKKMALNTNQRKAVKTRSPGDYTFVDKRSEKTNGVTFTIWLIKLLGKETW
jgi:hypothetical protein